ncbi:hypothetical protein [Coleofasciculus sp. FACHB-SPT9]|uniref:hypothetical protein n=1 Tax=Coleofasciculus sp. FACHB-SPT9 TaxID=2692791 RepID=UPI0016829FB9|nr:hypothetical protein [Coleofasciculus sp. FACHB-SPT9]MBD1892909.1 hypothetical protein [Coleofasciculus sp. FACHB-SPT9]
MHEFFATELTLVSGVEPSQPKTVNAAFKAIASWSSYQKSKWSHYKSKVTRLTGQDSN